jgi:endonuclease-3|tara:strand:- start:773 stop:1408 length:636 start_codon:yes stop_codon:yes gene_type:complete
VLNSRTVNNLYQKLNLQIPSPKTELLYNNNFQLLISVILTAQTTDKIVNLVTPILFNQYPDPKSIIQGGEKKIAYLIRKIGLAPTKAKHIIRTCKVLLEKHEGKIPDSREDLEKLPGVGRKTANVVLNEAFGLPTIAVDTHVFRVAKRTGLANGKTVLDVEKQLLNITPKKWKQNAHHYLILHGRYICKAKNFNCSLCVIIKECEYLYKSK